MLAQLVHDGLMHVGFTLPRWVRPAPVMLEEAG